MLEGRGERTLASSAVSRRDFQQWLCWKVVESGHWPVALCLYWKLVESELTLGWFRTEAVLETRAERTVMSSVAPRWDFQWWDVRTVGYSTSLCNPGL